MSHNITEPERQREAETLVLEIDGRGHGIPTAPLEYIMGGGVRARLRLVKGAG